MFHLLPSKNLSNTQFPLWACIFFLIFCQPNYQSATTLCCLPFPAHLKLSTPIHVLFYWLSFWSTSSTTYILRFTYHLLWGICVFSCHNPVHVSHALFVILLSNCVCIYVPCPRRQINYIHTLCKCLMCRLEHPDCICITLGCGQNSIETQETVV